MTRAKCKTTKRITNTHELYLQRSENITIMPATQENTAGNRVPEQLLPTDIGPDRNPAIAAERTQHNNKGVLGKSQQAQTNTNN